MKKKLALFFIIVGVVILVLSGLSLINENNSSDDFQKITINDHQLIVEVVDSPDELTLGLSFRDKIGSDGMLFVLPERRVPNFWMKDMKFDLDIIWIDGKKVIGISKEVPHPHGGENLSQLPIYSPNLPATHVLEIEAGEAEARGIEVGDQVIWN